MDTLNHTKVFSDELIKIAVHLPKEANVTNLKCRSTRAEFPTAYQSQIDLEKGNLVYLRKFFSTF